MWVSEKTIAGVWVTDSGKVAWDSWEEDNGLEKYLEGELVELDNGLYKMEKERVR